MPRHPPVPPEFLAQYDAERARVLRRRAVWYCAVVLAIVAFGWYSTIGDLLDRDRFATSQSTASGDLVFTVLFTLIFARALVYFARRPRSREEIVRAFQWLILVGGLAIAVVLPLLRHAPITADAIPRHTAEDDLAQGMASVLVLFVLHFLSSLLVALSPREGLYPLIPVELGFAAWVLFVSVVPAEEKAALLVAAPLAGVPGFAWSWWRYRGFAERFHARAIQRRYAEVTRELTDARRVHEALFPPPITRGPVRLAYSYEPMRAIGGDFLFVRPLSFPPSHAAGPIIVVLVDVTGHGIAAALAVNRLHAELQHLCREGALPSPAELLTALNAFALDALSPQGMFATAFCVRITPPDRHAGALEWAGAGHPPTMLRARDGTVRRLDSTAPMLGILDADLFSAEGGEADLLPGEALFLYTDGAFEAPDGRGGQLGLDGLERLIAETPASPGTRTDEIAAEVRSLREGPPTDDTLIVEVSLD